MRRNRRRKRKNKKMRNKKAKKKMRNKKESDELWSVRTVRYRGGGNVRDKKLNCQLTTRLSTGRWHKRRGQILEQHLSDHNEITSVVLERFVNIGINIPGVVAFLGVLIQN
ncbi:hypothetical protein RND71_003261 [Anisodus tanguticus]|uniref:Uncharacterized protein n=1 Tax=Anisodus tanguticus TaxID=243964 RepID=A0AAE1SVK5_9SOLA|nr:hypothetical protein RND71_003261 [Anisodus tanguticus]